MGECPMMKCMQPLAVGRLRERARVGGRSVLARLCILVAVGVGVGNDLLAGTVGAQTGARQAERVVVPLELLAGQAAFGTVVDAAMQPVEGATVRVDGRRLRTDARGRFDLSTERRPGRQVEVRLLDGDRPVSGRTVHSVGVVDGGDPEQISRLTDVPAYPARGGVVRLDGVGLRVDQDDLQVVFGDVGAVPLAGTPRAITVQVPMEIEPGATDLRVTSAAGSTEPVEVRVIDLELRPAETDLVRGEGSRLEVRVIGTEARLPLQVRNETPTVIRLQGGDDQSIETAGGRENRATVTYRGVGEGNWAIFIEAEPRLRLAEASDSVDSPSAETQDDPGVTPDDAPSPAAPGGATVFPDTGDVLVSGVRVPRAARDQATEGAPRADTETDAEACACRSCDLSDLDLLDATNSRTANTLRVGRAFRVQARPVVRCDGGCQGTVTGNWSLTFVPYTSSSRRLFLRRPVGVGAPRGTSEPPLQITGRGGSIEFTPDRPGTLIAHFAGRCACGETFCPEPVRASAEWRIGFDSIDEERLEALEREMMASLPRIGRGDGQPSLAEVGDWLARTTSWRRGTLYDQVLELPEGAVGVEQVHIVGRGAINQRGGRVEGVLQSGDEVRGLANVFERQQTTWVRIEGEPGALRLRYTAPTVDRFIFKVRTVDAEGRTQRVDLVCPGTSGPDGDPVRDACQTPASGHVRIAILNVHPSRIEDVLLENLMARLAQAYGATSKLSARGPAWDAGGREAVFSHYLLSDYFLCPDLLVPHLEGLARALGATIEVHDHFIVLRGSDFDGPGLVPTWLGGRRSPAR